MLEIEQLNSILERSLFWLQLLESKHVNDILDCINNSKQEQFYKFIKLFILNFQIKIKNS